jgi:hypothetical protein
MNCYFHPDREAVGNCRGCGKAVCTECHKPAQSGFYCPQCVQNGVPFQVSIATSPLAIVSLVLSILGVPLTFCYGCGLVFSIAGIVTGLIARYEIGKNAGRQGGGGMALAGLIIGLATIGLVVLGSVCYMLFFVILMLIPTDQSYSLLAAAASFIQ